MPADVCDSVKQYGSIGIGAANAGCQLANTRNTHKTDTGHGRLKTLSTQTTHRDERQGTRTERTDHAFTLVHTRPEPPHIGQANTQHTQPAGAKYQRVACADQCMLPEIESYEGRWQ